MDPNEAPTTHCDHCGKSPEFRKICARCRSVGYCGRPCQQAAWPNHKKDCKPDTRTREAPRLQSTGYVSALHQSISNNDPIIGVVCRDESDQLCSDLATCLYASPALSGTVDGGIYECTKAPFVIPSTSAQSVIQAIASGVCQWRDDNGLPFTDDESRLACRQAIDRVRWYLLEVRNNPHVAESIETIRRMRDQPSGVTETCARLISEGAWALWIPIGGHCDEIRPVHVSARSKKGKKGKKGKSNVSLKSGIVYYG